MVLHVSDPASFPQDLCFSFPGSYSRNPEPNQPKPQPQTPKPQKPKTRYSLNSKPQKPQTQISLPAAGAHRIGRPDLAGGRAGRGLELVAQVLEQRDV